MANSTYDRTGSVAPTAERTSFWRDHFAAAAVVALSGAVIGIVGAFIGFRILSTGDEPPIRVKGGSIELHLLSKDATWTNAGNHYKTVGTRGNDTYQVKVSGRC